MAQEIPFYIVCFNRVYGLKQAMAFVDRSSIPIRPIVLDMGSTWPPFLEYRDSLGVRVEHFDYGIGPRDLFTNGFLTGDGDGPFYFSDGDLDYSKTESTAFEAMKTVSERFPWFPKIGLALPISEVPRDSEGERVRKWERENWRVEFADGIYLNGIDTTIAYYPRREDTFYYRPSLRLAQSNSARHYPWFERQDSDEAIFYSSLAKASISSTAAGIAPSRRFKLKHLILTFLYFAIRIPLRFSATGAACVRLLAINATIPSKQN